MSDSNHEYVNQKSKELNIEITEHELAIALENMENPNHPDYNPEVIEQLYQNNPAWRPDGVEN